VSGRAILPMTIDRLGYAADGAALLDDLSLRLPAGGATVLLGANGAGKSLLLRLVMGLLRPSAGAIRFAAPHPQPRMAMVFQKPVMLRRSARANIAHALRARGAGLAAARAGAEAALERFGLAALARRPARLLSGGEQQRLAIARAAALDPELLLLDEPTAALDPGAAARVEAMLQELKAAGVTLLFSTHHVGQAARLADRVLFLRRGRLIEDSPAPRFFAAPATPQARAFLAGELDW